MTTELTYLALTLILALVHILAPALGRTAQFGLAWNAGALKRMAAPSQMYITVRSSGPEPAIRS